MKQVDANLKYHNPLLGTSWNPAVDFLLWEKGNNFLEPPATSLSTASSEKVNMENRPDLSYQRILENVRHYFEFLFKRGFRIASFIFTDPDHENWHVTLTTNEYLIEIYGNVLEVHVALSTLELYKQVGLFELIDLIYLILGDEEVPNLRGELPLNEAQSFQKAARLLETYLDEVLMEIDSIPILPSTDDFLRDIDKKSGQLSKDNCPDFCSKVGSQPLIL